MRPQINKFQWPEMFNDSQGKTCAILVIGFIGALIGGLGVLVAANTVLILCVLHKEGIDPNVISFLSMMVIQCIGLYALGMGALGADRISKDKVIPPDAVKDLDIPPIP